MNRFFKRTLSMILAVLMIFGSAPQIVSAMMTEETAVCEDEHCEEHSHEEHIDGTEEKILDSEESAEYTVKLELSGVSSDAVSSVMPEGTIYYAACGDSITHANHALVDDIDADDPYYPIDGYSGTTYARKNYAYYIAKNNDLQWANYGYGGTTLHHCYPEGYGGTSMRTYPFVDERITQLQEDVEWDYISLFFGYNDVVYGPVQQRDFWLTETYGQELGYPIKDEQIGAEGFANAEQKAACDAVTGFVGGVEYTDNTEYFFAKFMGTVDDTETTTFLGAYNYALDYLTKKYPDAKILIINSYVSGTNSTRKIFREGVNAIAEKWGVSCMDFSDLSYWFYGVDQKRVEFPNPEREDGRWYAENGKASFAGTIEGYNRARFTTDGTHPGNLGYQTISKPIERALIETDNIVNVPNGNSFETELVLDDVYTDMDVSVTMGGADITDLCYDNGKIRIESVTGNAVISAVGNITYTLASAPSSFSTLSEAALALREKMIARESPATIRVAEGILPSEVLAKAWEHNGTPNEGDYIRHNQIGHSYTTVSGEDENGAYTEITYTFNWLTTAEQEAEVDAAVDAVLAELDLWEKTDYEKIKGVYDWITENVQYDFNNEDNDEYQLCHSTYAAIILKDAVCQGYATLFYRMMLELGVDSRYIRGMAGYVEIEYHAWNIVALDGKYYNMDATWDRDLMGHYRMFLCTEANFTEHIPDSEYTTAEWKAKYPMAVVPYVFNVAASGKLSNGMEWVLDGDTGTLTVAGKGAIPSYRYNYAPWYNYKDSVKAIVISEGITEVGERAFYWCVNCTSLSLPSTLTAIREYGFNNLRNLEYVTLPENLRIMEFCAFSECVALKEIVIPDSVTTCGTSVFSNCYGLKKAVIGNGLKVIPDSMFFADKNLREVTLPDGLTEIGDTAFADCGLFYFTIPASLRTLGSSVFSGCRNLYDFTVDAGNQYYKAIGGVLFTKDGKTLVSYPGGDIASYYYVPNGTEIIARSAFNEAYRLEHVYFPDSLREIKPYAFAYCNALWSVIFTPNITRIGDSAFRSCKGLYSAIFENPDVVLEASVFADCDTMEFIYLPSRLREIPNGLFYGSQRLSEVEIPSTVTKIGSSAFLDCDSLKTITVPGTVKSVEQQAFDYCDKLETIIFEEGVQRIGWLAIRNNPKLKKVVIPSSVTTFDRPSGTSDKTFDACPNVVVYVNCGTAGWNYVRNYGISYSASHPYTNSTVVQPTCTSQGYTRYYCNCGTYSYNSNYTSALGHSYNSSVTPPTCTEEGYTTYTCRRCGYSYNGNYVPENGHSLVLTGYVEPTCTEPGYSGDEVCSVCGTTYYGEEIPETGHDFVSGICVKCGETKKPYQRITYFSVEVEAENGKTYSDNAVLYLPKNYSINGEPVKLVIYCKQGAAQITSSSNPIESVGFYNYLLNLGYAILGVDGVPDAWRDELVIGERAVGNPLAVQGTEKAYDYVVENYNIASDGCFISGYSQGGHYTQNVIDLTDIPILAAAEQSPVCSMRYHQWDLNATVTVGGVKFTKGARVNVARIYGFPAFSTNDELLKLEYNPALVDAYDPWVRNSKNVYTEFVQKGNLWYLPEGTSVDDITMSHSVKCPVKIWCAEDDTAVSADVMKVFAKAIQNGGGIAEISVAKSGGHGFFQNQPAIGSFTENGKQYKTLPIAVEIAEWFERFGGYSCVHNFVLKNYSEPTCTEPGYSGDEVCSVCGTTYYGEEIPETGHFYDEYVTPPTCTEQGYTTYTCIYCGESYIENYVPALGHTEGETVVENSVAPTCGKDGSHDEVVYCEVCGEELSRKTVVDKATGEHVYSTEKERVEPTCTEDGYFIMACGCGATQRTEIPALGHTEVIDKAVAPTCTETGLTEGKHCSVCGEILVKQNVVPALGHTEVIDEAVAPTCTETGLTVGKHCSVCGEVLVKQNVVPALGHTEVIDKAVAPTCTETGLTEGKHCSVCEEVLVKQNVVPALGHTEVIDKAVAPTCTETGLTEGKHCSVCGEVLVKQNVIPALGHTEVIDKAVAPTCTETGLTEGKHCSVCGEILVAQEIVPALGHTEVIDKAVAPTCTETGLTEGKHCSVCGEILVKQNVVPALGHTEVIDKAVAPTCTETGLTEGKHCSVCGEILVAQEIVPALGHTEVIDKAVAPTCTETGLTEGKHCSVCGEILVKQNVVPALGHTEVVDKAVAPTCTETGLTEGKHCSVCGEVLVKQNVVPALGHTEVIDKAVAPTCTETGLTEGKHCSVCGEVLVKQNVVPALGHTEVIDKAVAPTCTETGLTEGKHCSVCGEVLVAQEIVPATGHNYESVITEPTCTEQGYTTHTCSVCGDSYVDSYVEATGHSFGEWYTVTEATPTEPGEERRDCENCEHYETQEIPPKGYEIGDINLDGKVDVMDAYYIRLVVAKLRKPTEQQILLGDVDLDGKITAIDANIIRKFAIKMIETLPVQ